MSVAEKKLLKTFRSLPERERTQVLKILRAIQEGARTEDMEFDLWARLLSRRKGFSSMRESDVARAVRDFRKSR
jgi:hypothetical protein